MRTTQNVASKLPTDWADALVRHGLRLADLQALIEAIYDTDTTAEVYPERTDLFRAFHLTPLSNVRAVILGQDPYPTKGQAHGLAFSVRGDQSIPRSLRTMFRNLAEDPNIRMGTPSNGDLTPWAESGVLLLNSALTVQGRPGSHLRRWKWFTDLVLQVVNEECDRVAFLAWGSHALSKIDAIGVANTHTVIRTAHPAAWGRSKERRFQDCHPFSEANAFLREPIDWHPSPANVL